MHKIKRILPSLREKEHYIAFEVISEERLNKNNINEAIFDANKSYLGELGCAKANFNVLDYDENNRKGMIKANSKYVDYIKGSLALIKRIKNTKVIVKTMGVSGTIKKLKNHGYQKEV